MCIQKEEEWEWASALALVTSEGLYNLMSDTLLTSSMKDQLSRLLPGFEKKNSMV